MSGFVPVGRGLGLPLMSVPGAPTLVPAPMAGEKLESRKSPFASSRKRGSPTRLLEPC